jgi:hypothetical protein
VFMKLTSFRDVEFGSVGKFGQRDALGRLWSFVGPDAPHALDLYVATPGARPRLRVGASYQIIQFPGKTGCTEMGLIGHDRKNNRSYRILQSA